MTSNYTDSFAGDPYNIASGKPLSAAGVNAALNTREKVANKKDSLNDSSTEYPSSKAVAAALNEKADVSAVTDLQNVMSAKQDKLSDEQLALLASLKTLSFFPKGTILTFSAAAWDAKDSAFKAVWKICNGQNGTPNLVDKFLRGGDYGDDRKTGGTNTAQVPYHNHTFTGVEQTGYIPADYTANTAWHPHYSRQPEGVFSISKTKPDNEVVVAGHGWTGSRRGYHFSMTPTGAVSYAGSSADNRPEFYTVIYIMKIS